MGDVDMTWGMWRYKVPGPSARFMQLLGSFVVAL